MMIAFGNADENRNAVDDGAGHIICIFCNLNINHLLNTAHLFRELSSDESSNYSTTKKLTNSTSNNII